ncbi:MAG: sigma 54-dependent Fis family transcriptional regulator [Kofleriaceae bacterium]|nr:sigma 54-dependent Fis family transcriptional regulator [Kofleriaceae bacterium]
MTAAPPRGLATLLHGGTLAVAVQIRGFAIEVVEGPDAGKRFEPRSRSVVIGTDPSADVVLNDPYVSRVHARIDVQQTGYVLRDLGSRNGTRVASVWAREVWLGDDVAFTLGTTTLRFRLLDAPFELALPREESFEGLLGRSAAMREVFAICERVAPSDVPALLVGETGTGKELVARAIHARSRRKERAFVVLDCAALSPTLVESELFGHEKGAFTSAVSAHEGVFERADGGTVFLDELGELPPDLQPKLLRALETGEVRRLGGTKTIKVDVRVIAATNRDLVGMIAENRFRADLYYRLAVVQVTVPPLRARRDDVPLLARHFAERARQARPENMADDLDLDRVLGELRDYGWPGNVRELRNLVERASILSDLAGTGAPKPLGQAMAEVAGRPPTLREARAAADRAYVEDVLKRADGDLDRAAEIADVHRKTLERMLREQRRADTSDDDAE